MVFNFIVHGTVRAKDKEEACNKLKDEFGSEMFSKHIEVTNEVEDRGQKVEIE